MGAEWQPVWPRWLTAELALDEWRERIERVAEEEAAYLAGLPYVSGVAIIGSVGRGSQWPLSDIDLLVVLAQVDWETQKEIISVCFEAQLECGRVFSATCYSTEEIEHGPLRSSPLVLAGRPWMWRGSCRAPATTAMPSIVRTMPCSTAAWRFSDTHGACSWT